MKYVYGFSVAAGILMVLGTAGADCDGKCMENSLSIMEILGYSFAGLALIALGSLGLYVRHGE